jgi:hypothetical protein
VAVYYDRAFEKYSLYCQRERGRGRERERERETKQYKNTLREVMSVAHIVSDHKMEL